MDQLTNLESESIYVIREAYARYRKLGMLWSMGKDSTALLWMVRKAFLGRRDSRDRKVRPVPQG